MNAPKEYYPAGYEKNFDDNFMSKVDLPATSFHCGDQKHFPGLYGDMDLGCMVRCSMMSFHHVLSKSAKSGLRRGRFSHIGSWKLLFQK